MAACIVCAQGASVIKEIEVKGNQNINKDVILAAMTAKVGQPFAQAQLDQDKKAIEELGFFQAVDVRAKELDANNWSVSVEIVEFAKIKEVRIVGNSVVKTDKISNILADSLIAPGNVYCLKAVSPTVAAIKKLYNDKGYFVDVEEFGPLPESPETINVKIVELTVNSVAFQGAARTKPRILNRLVKTRAGDTFNTDLWRDDVKRVWNTQWFERIDPMVKQADELGKIDLILDVKEAKTGLFNVGLQMDPRSHLAGLARFQEANFNGTGQSVGVGYVQGTGGGGSSVDLSYGNPFIDRHDTSMNLSLYSRLIYRFTNTFGGSSSSISDEDRFFERRTGGTAAFSRLFQRQLTGIFGLRWERIATSDVNPKVTEGFIQQDGEVASTTLALVSNRRDTDVEPSRGDWFKIQTEPGFAKITKVAGDTGDSGLLGNHSFVRSNVEYRKYWSSQPPRKQLDDPRRVVAFRAKVGTITGTVPFFEQFFVGGSDSLRGYPEDRFWGKQMALATLEYRQPIQKSFNAILFVDYGGAWGGFGSVRDFTQTTRPEFKLGYGLGFSFRTPLGPIRLDFGFNQNGQSRTHFLIGTAF